MPNKRSLLAIPQYWTLFSVSRMLMTVIVGVSLFHAALGQAQEEEQATLRWHGHTIVTNKPLPRMPEGLALRAFPQGTPGYYFVQFTGPITKAMKEQVTAAGGILQNYVPNNAYLVKLNEAARDNVKALSVVQAVVMYQPGFRVSKSLMRRVETMALGPVAPTPPTLPLGELRFKKRDATPKSVVPESGQQSLTLTVLVFKGEDVGAIKDAVTRMGGTVLSTTDGKLRTQLRVTVPPNRVTGVAQTNGVMWVEEFKLPKLHNNVGSGVMTVPTVAVPPTDLRGNGQIVGVADSGLDVGVNDATMHDDFEGRITGLFSWPVQAGTGASNVGADDGAADVNSGHGTHVTGSVMGNGVVSGNVIQGAAPEATLIFQAIEQFTTFPGGSGSFLSGIPADLNDLFQQAYDQGARIHTNSWGSDDAGAYSDDSFNVDQFVWDNPDMLILFAAGNAGLDSDGNNIIDAGSIGSPATCKNCLSVGASENNRPDIPNQYLRGQDGVDYQPTLRDDRVADNVNGMAAFSSRGPTQSGRIKPDVVAPGTMILSPRTQAPANTVLRTDNMETNNGQWTANAPWARVTTNAHSGNTSWHDSPTGNYADNVDVSLTWAPVDLSSGGSQKVLQLWMQYSLGTGDQWTLEISDPSFGTGTVGPFTGTQVNWVPLPIALGPLSSLSNVQVKVRLQSDNDGNTGDGVYIDDVRIVDGAFGRGLPSDFGLASVGGPEDQNYMFLQGTSMATPLTAGAAALVRQYYVERLGVPDPSGALLRATMINGATDMTPGQYSGIVEVPMRPNSVEGWGRVNLKDTVAPDSPAQLRYVDETTGLETSEEKTYDFSIDNTSVPIAVTMVYHDFPGAALVNNLDMSITTPSGTTLQPNGRTTPDTVNNVEQVVIPATDTEMGTYTIRVTAQNVPEGPQPFALAMRAGEMSGPPPDAADLAVSITGPREVKVGENISRDIDLEVRNEGTDPATGTQDAGGNGYMVDVVLSSDKLLPIQFATFSENFHEDVLLRGGRVSNTQTLASGLKIRYAVGATIPADTQPGRYCLGAVVDPGMRIHETNEDNNTSCQPIIVSENCPDGKGDPCRCDPFWIKFPYWCR